MCRALPCTSDATATNPWAVLHDPWRFGYVLGKMCAVICGMLSGSVAVRSEIVARAIADYSRVCSGLSESRKGRTRASILDLGDDLGCFGTLTYMF